jgi:hypothetical protein
MPTATPIWRTMARGRAAIPSTALQQPADPSRRLAPESRSRRDRFFAQLLIGAFTLVLIVASLITIVEKPLTFSSLGASVNWGVQTILGQGDSSYVTSPSTASMSGPARSSRGGISHLMRGATTVG